jgi:AraC-like DNA-binding protein
MLEETRPTGFGRAKGLVFHRQSGKRIETRTFAPPIGLRTYVESLWISRWDFRGQPSHVVQMLADPGLTVAFESQSSRVVGLYTGLWQRELRDRGLIRAAKLKPGAGQAFFNLSMWQLKNVTHSMGALFSNMPKRLESRVLKPSDDVEGLTVVSDWLHQNLRASIDANVALAMQLVDLVAKHREIVSVEVLSRKAGVTPRPLQRLFREFVGVSPKWMIRRFRLQEAALRIERRDGSLTTIAAELGYADQAHLSRDFRAATGRTPTALASGKE